ncbi:MAG: lambda exonuclease family protein [Candidatus Omnitrophota bacterium]
MSESKIIDCVQGSDEWFAVKLGKISSSRISEVMAKSKDGKGYGVTRLKYMKQLIAERITGERQESYTNSAMARGTEIEPQAREHYAKLNPNCVIKQVGFIQLSEDEGSSPDALVDNDGTLEIKCPSGTTHIDNILDDCIPSEYIPQVQHQLYVSGRSWCDFMSFYPAFKKTPALIKRVYRDEVLIEKMKKEVAIFLGELNEMMNKINNEEF